MEKPVRKNKGCLEKGTARLFNLNLNPPIKPLHKR